MAPKGSVFKKQGQKRATPAKTNALRIFYSSLYKENPNSKMALKWLIEHGCFGPKKTEAVILQQNLEKLSI
jgi:hypothetical protein